ncbi:MAG: hypothetical protein K8S13_07970 [Desulfobacula sp.]|uniref:hypothetical protein n=1 Tax=Desulfobacula sp. TaxID=2593537 RepID=UPI0025B8DF5C|nr:hypothetical protein [Desulfobacula sp.]MCD4719784.1 hypothetical protein [Desulfobacula sp.]
MRKDKKTKVILLAILILFLSVSIASSVFAYGGSDGPARPEDSDSYVAPQKPTKLTDKEIKKIFSLLGTKSGKTMSETFSGTSRTARQLMSIRQAILEGDMQRANAEASLIHGLTVTVEFLDEAGQWSELGLSFVPGVGWAAQGALAAARGGADAYKKEKKFNFEVLKGATIKAVSSVVVNKLSPLGADMHFNNAKAAVKIATKGIGKHGGKAVEIFVKNAVKYGVKKETERRAGNALEDVLKNAAKKTPNRAPRPVYMGPGRVHITPSGQKLYE